MFGVFFGVGLGLGLINAVLVQRSVDAITAGDHPLKRKMALNSATRLLVISAIGLTIAFVFRPARPWCVVRPGFVPSFARFEYGAAGVEENAHGRRQ